MNRQNWLFCAAACVAAGCGGKFETRTFPIQHLTEESALNLISPYLSANALATFSEGANALTVTGRPMVLEEVAAVLAQYDRAAPAVRFKFQLIRADGFADSDPAIREVEEALRELFRFDGYRLDGEVLLTAIETTSAHQSMMSARTRFDINMQFLQAHREDGSVAISVHLSRPGMSVFDTTVRVPIGQTVVLGSLDPAMSGDGRGALILTVRPDWLD